MLIILTALTKKNSPVKFGHYIMYTFHVLRTEVRRLKTNKGDLLFPLTYVDSEIKSENLTNGFFITGSDSLPWKPYNNPLSILEYYSEPLRYTEFETLDGFIKAVYINNIYTITINYSTGPISTSIPVFTNQPILTPSYIFITDGKGNGFFGSTSTPFDVSSSIRANEFDITSYPSNYSFGKFTYKDFIAKASGGGDYSKQSYVQQATEFLNHLLEISNDPYDKGGTSSGDGGNGTFGGGSTIFGGNTDNIDIPELPTLSACDAGFISLFNPSLSQLHNLASYMWSDLFSLDTFKKIFADPMDCILGLSIVPVKPTSSGITNVKIGNIETDISMTKTNSQYVSVDCGTIDVKEYWGAYLDYSPYTECSIYLPYVGTKPLSVDDIMNKPVHVVYHVDILSGACNAYVKCGASVLYTFVGQCGASIPITGNDWTNVVNGAISVAGKIGFAMATGGATAIMSSISASSSIISDSKPTIERSGAMSSTGGMLGIQKPYMILTRPKQALPENQNKYTGYPSFITMGLGDCSGYTEIETIRLDNMSCTDDEIQEIENLLKSGVIF